ncbi:TerD family protein [Nocardia carnea]|uniref:TerD family protein n=1 Tax=Nocardia carnea TaxID=37328 RepID=UPI0024543F85|nr:TerD family protein [Nocardia carnea]
MSETIGKGANTALRGGRVRISATPAGIDLTVLCLRENGKVGSDDDFVFYNQPVSPDSAVRLVDGALSMDLSVVAAGTHRLVVAASVDTGSFGAIPLAVRVTEEGGGSYELPITGLTSETTVQLAEVYRRGGGWKLRNIGQGYATGLAGLATDFGITVDDPGTPAATPPTPAPAAAGCPSVPGDTALPVAGYPPPPGPPGYPPPGGLPPATAEYPPAYRPVPAAGGSAAGGASAPAAPRAASAPGVNFSKGAVTLTKGASAVLLEKATMVRLRVAWASGTDYEAYALVVLGSGEVVHVATFPAAGIPANPRFRDLVRHLGDRGRGDVRRGGGQTEEIIEVRLAPEIVAVVPVAYSAINNGTGSFHKYRVTLSIESGADTVTIPADQAKKSSWIFTCVPGIVYNRPEGVLVERLELYSRRFSEHRPAVTLQPDGRVDIRMDKGPVNQFKADRT